MNLLAQMDWFHARHLSERGEKLTIRGIFPIGIKFVSSRISRVVSVKTYTNNNTNNGYNCTNKPTCPLNGKCLTPCITYAAIVAIGSTEKALYGSTRGPFKPRFSRHNFSFRHCKNKTDTRLSKLVWDLTNQGISFSIKWLVVSKSHLMFLDQIDVTFVSQRN